MAALSSHPVAPAPTAPARASTRHLLLRAYCILLLFIALATTFWFNLLGAVGLAILLAATAVAILVIWIAGRIPVAAPTICCAWTPAPCVAVRAAEVASASTLVGAITSSEN